MLSRATSHIRRRLARRIEEAFAAQHALEVHCDPVKIDFPRGFYRTNPRADTYRWTAHCTHPGMRVGPSVDCYDTATACARFGVTLVRQPYDRGWEATANA